MENIMNSSRFYESDQINVMKWGTSADEAKNQRDKYSKYFAQIYRYIQEETIVLYWETRREVINLSRSLVIDN